MWPVLFKLGPFEVRFYGLMYVVAIVVGSLLIRKEVKRKAIGLKEEEVMDFVLWAVVGGIVGARLYYVLFNWQYYLSVPLEIPAIWHGGLAIHGGIIGGLMVAYIYLRRKNIPFWKMADAVAPAIILGQAFGRFGNFMNGDAHGVPTTLPWGVVFPPDSIAGREFPGIPIHPTMLYEMVLNLCIFTVLWFVLRKREHKEGFIFATYLVLYSAGRFFVEAFRADSLMLGPFRAAQLVSLALMIVASTIIWKRRLWTKKK